MLCEKGNTYGKYTPKGDNKTRYFNILLDELQKSYPDNFLYIPTKIIWSGVTRIGNHTKLFAGGIPKLVEIDVTHF